MQAKMRAFPSGIEYNRDKDNVIDEVGSEEEKDESHLVIIFLTNHENRILTKARKLLNFTKAKNQKKRP